MEFKEYKLSDLSKGNKGTYGIGASAVDYRENLYTYLRITDIKEDGTLDYTNLKSVDDKNAEKYILEKGDIVFARTGNSTGKAYYYDGEIQNLVYAGFLIKFSLDEKKVNPKFMKYYTMTKEYKNWVKEIQTGSTRGNINEKMYGNMKVKLPSRIYQDKMVDLLEGIDKKIELNSHINNNLYEVGMELLKNDFILENERKPLSQVIKFVKGKKPIDISANKQVGYEKYLTIACLNGQELNYADTTKMIMSDNDLLMVMDGASSGDVYYGGQGIVGSTLARIDCIDNNYISEFIFFSLKYYKDLIQSKNTGSAIPHTDKVFVGSLEIPKMNIKKQEKYKVLLSKIQHNQNENETLENLRNTLLPKLMNGEIDLNKVEL